jgi:BNR/Asp-box repeat
MVTANRISVASGDALLLVGTTKGAFLLSSGASRRRWEVGGPHFPGLSIYALAYDGRAGRHRIWAAPKSEHWGAELVSSDDFGRRWKRPETPAVRFPAQAGASLANIWQITLGGAPEPDVLYMGVEPAALFASRDGGESWALNEPLWNHPHRPRWTPGGGGLCLHTILPGDRLLVAVSAAGVYRSDDGGESWQARNRGISAYFLPEKNPEFGQCVHKVVRDPHDPERLYLQHHFGLYRSDDGGDTWRDIGRGVPSDFGFGMAIHPRDGETVWIVPLEADVFRCPPEGKLRVYRTRNGGRSWQAMTHGLPQRLAFETVLRDALAADALDPAGVYFGTRSGKLFASRDEGRTWRMIAEGLPPITCVKTAVVENAGRTRVRGSRPGKPKPRRRRRAA